MTSHLDGQWEVQSSRESGKERVVFSLLNVEVLADGSIRQISCTEEEKQVIKEDDFYWHVADFIGMYTEFGEISFEGGTDSQKNVWQNFIKELNEYVVSHENDVNLEIYKNILERISCDENGELVDNWSGQDVSNEKRENLESTLSYLFERGQDLKSAQYIEERFEKEYPPGELMDLQAHFIKILGSMENLYKIMKGESMESRIEIDEEDHYAHFDYLNSLLIGTDAFSIMQKCPKGEILAKTMSGDGDSHLIELLIKCGDKVLQYIEENNEYGSGTSIKLLSVKDMLESENQGW